MRPFSFDDLHTLRSVPHLSRLAPRYQSYPVYLEQMLRQFARSPHHVVGKTRQDIRPEKIVGTVGPCPDYDADFVPRMASVRSAWESARDALLAAEPPPSIEAVELGGCYFARTGFEVVSAAKLHLVRAIPATVERYESPVVLPPSLDRHKIAVFRSKLEFHEATGAFDHISQDAFSAAKQRTWRVVTDSVFDRSSDRLSEFVKRANRPPPKERPSRDVVMRWYEGVYATVIRYVAESCLALDMPDSHDTDIFAAVICHWRNCPPYTSLAYAFRQFADRVRERNHLVRSIKSVAPGETGRMRFFRVSRIEQYIPHAQLPYGSDRWYGYLADQIQKLSAETLTQRLGRQPNMREVITTWYNDILEPTHGIYQASPREPAFPGLYVHWVQSEPDFHTNLASQTNGAKKRLSDSFARYISSYPSSALPR